MTKSISEWFFKTFREAQEFAKQLRVEKRFCRVTVQRDYRKTKSQGHQYIVREYSRIPDSGTIENLKESIAQAEVVLKGDLFDDKFFSLYRKNLAAKIALSNL